MRIMIAMTIQKNLKREMQTHNNITQYELSKLSGVPQPTIQRILKGSNPKSDTIKKLADGLQISTARLLGGEADQSQLSNITNGPGIHGQIPLISWVQAGSWFEAHDPFQVGDAEAWYPCPVNHSDQAFVLRVRGSSMEPEYMDGDLIFVDPHVQYQHNSDVVVRLNNAGETTFKRLQDDGHNKYLLALNKAFPNPVIPLDEEAQICGVVIFSGRPR